MFPYIGLDIVKYLKIMHLSSNIKKKMNGA